MSMAEDKGSHVQCLSKTGPVVATTAEWQHVKANIRLLRLKLGL